MAYEVMPVEILPELKEEKFVKEKEKDAERPALNIPAKERKLITQPFDFIIGSLESQIENKSLVLQDKFQRRRVWDDAKCSKLIESLLLNVPIPVCYFAEISSGVYSVIDGQQRLSAIYSYITNQFPLKSLRIRPELNRKRFFEISPEDQRQIKSRAIRCIVILMESHPDIRFDVFERLNTGSVRLNTQELRNSMYRGALNDLIRDLSENKNFLICRNVTAPDKRMQDCELVLRFFAFHFNLGDYNGRFAEFLDNYLKHGQKLSSEEISAHHMLFERVIENVHYVFGASAFRRFTEHDSWERLVNRAIYDVIMLSFAKLDPNVIRAQRSQILTAFKAVCKNQTFKDSITSWTKDRKRVQDRLTCWTEALNSHGVFMAPLIVGK